MPFATTMITVPYIEPGVAMPAAGQDLMLFIKQGGSGSGPVTLPLGGGDLVKFGALRSKVGSWERLPHDWDGNDGIPPSSETVEAAKSVLNALEARGATIPTLQLAGDGEISFIWDPAGNFASISLLNDGHLVGYVRAGTEIKRVDEQFFLVDLEGFISHVVNAV